MNVRRNRSTRQRASRVNKFYFLAGSKKPIFEIPSKRVNWSTIVLRLTLQFPHAAETSEKHRYCFQTLIEKLSKIIWLGSSCLLGERIEATKWNLLTFRVSITSWMMSSGDFMFNHTINTACITYVRAQILWSSWSHKQQPSDET